MSEPNAPKIEFPCDYNIKVIGDAADDLVDVVVAVVEVHAPGVDRDRIKISDSRTGRFVSVQLTIVATGEPQLKAIFDDLKATGRVYTVL